MSNSRKRAIAYPRVSGSVQEDGTSLDTQAAAMVEMASGLGHTIVPEDVLPEVGTGINLDRPVLNRIRAMAAAGEIDALFAYSTDRLSRDPVDLLVLVREFKGHGVEVYFVQDPSDNSPEGELVRFVLGFSAGREHAQIRERTTRGKLATARGGRMPVGASSQPYGLDYDPVLKRRVVNATELPILKRIFRQYVEGWSMYRIAKTLNAEGIPSKTGVSWSVTAIRLILKNTSYIGVDYYGRKKLVRGPRGESKQVRVPKEEWIEIRGYTPQLISEAVFRKANERLKQAQERNQGRTNRRYFMSGFARCGWCESPVVGAGRTGKYWYYRCSSRTRGLVVGQKGCQGSYCINGAWLEGQVWSHVTTMVRDPSGVIADLELNSRTGGGDIGEMTERLRAEVVKLGQEESRVLGLYRRGKVRVELLDEEMDKISASVQSANERLQELEEQRVKEENATAAGERIREYCRQVSTGLEGLDADGKRALMSRLGVKVVVVKRDLMITAEIDSGFLVNEDTSA